MSSEDVTLNNRWREFLCYHSEIIDYELVIKPVFTRFISLGISFNYNDKKRNTFMLQGDMRFGWKGIGLLMCTFKREDPMTLIWSLYHEYAHTTQPPQSDEQAIPGSWAELKREIDAWIIAEKELRNYPFFKDHLDSYKNLKKRTT